MEKEILWSTRLNGVFLLNDDDALFLRVDRPGSTVLNRQCFTKKRPGCGLLVEREASRMHCPKSAC